MDVYDLFVIVIAAVSVYLFVTKVVKPLVRWLFDTYFSSGYAGTAVNEKGGYSATNNSPSGDGVVRMVHYVRHPSNIDRFSDARRQLRDLQRGDMDDIAQRTAAVVMQDEIMRARFKTCFDILSVSPRNLSVLVSDPETGDTDEARAVDIIESITFDDFSKRVTRLVTKHGTDFSLAFPVADIFPELAVIHSHSGDTRIKFALAGRVHNTPWPWMSVIYSLALHFISLPVISTVISLGAKLFSSCIPSAASYSRVADATPSKRGGASHLYRPLRGSCERKLCITDFSPEIVAWFHAYHRLNVTQTIVSVDLRRSVRIPVLRETVEAPRDTQDILDTASLSEPMSARKLWVELVAAYHTAYDGTAPHVVQIEEMVMDAKIMLERSRTTERVSAPIYPLEYELECVDYATWARPTPYETAAAIFAELRDNRNTRFFYTRWLLRGLPLCFRESIEYHREPFDYPVTQWPKRWYLWFVWKRLCFRVLRGIHGPRYATYTISWALARTHEDVEAMASTIGYDTTINAPRFELYWGTKRRYLQKDISFLSALRSAVLA